MIDDGRARLDHLGRLVLTGLGMGALVGVTTSAVVVLAAGQAGSGYLQGYLLAGVVLGMVVGVVAGAGIAAVALTRVDHRPRSGPEPVTVFAAVALTVPVVVIACVWLDAAAVGTVVAVAVAALEAILVLRLTRRWRWAALGR